MGKSKMSADFDRQLRQALKNPNKKLRELLEKLERESPEAQAQQLAEGKRHLAEMKTHPNYKFPEPDYREDSIEFTCRAISELISPPQVEGESEELECVNIKLAVLAYSYELRAIWQLWLLSRRQTVERFSVKKSVPPDRSPNYPVAVWKLDELPVVVWWRPAEEEWYGTGGKTWERNYFDYWAFLPHYQ